MRCVPNAATPAFSGSSACCQTSSDRPKRLVAHRSIGKCLSAWAILLQVSCARIRHTASLLRQRKSAISERPSGRSGFFTVRHAMRKIEQECAILMPISISTSSWVRSRPDSKEDKNLGSKGRDGSEEDIEVGSLDETGRRPHWTEVEKLRIVAESPSESRLVSSTARRHSTSRLRLTTGVGNSECNLFRASPSSAPTSGATSSISGLACRVRE